MSGIASDDPDRGTISDDRLELERPSTPTTNGHNDDDIQSSEPPLKKRRVSETRPKKESPPWKKISAEGPSSFTQDGVRKSGRTNRLPAELQSPSGKRRSRATEDSPVPAKRGPGRPPKVKAVDSTSANGAHRSSAKTNDAYGPPRTSKSSSSGSSPALVRSRKAGNAARAAPAPGSRRSTRVSEIQHNTPVPDREAKENGDFDQKLASPRIRLKVRPFGVPKVHPGHILPRPKRFPTLEEYLRNSADVPLEEGGLYSNEDDVVHTEEAALKEARLIVRLEEATKPGGILSEENSLAYLSDDFEPESRLPPQYSHQDHMVRAAIGFRALMVEEQKKHKRNAKRLAEACRDEWHRKQPKTIEELEAEARHEMELKYRGLIKTLQATWDNVKAEVYQRRLKEWQAAEQIRISKALNERVDDSKKRLEAQRASHHGSDIFSNNGETVDEDGEFSDELSESGGSDQDREGEDNDDESDSNMSSSELEHNSDSDEEEVGNDEHLSVEQLKAKYSNLPEPLPDIEMPDAENESLDAGTPIPESADLGQDADMFDDSDESVDMDDDTTSDEDDDGSSEEGSDDEDDDDDADGPMSLFDFYPELAKPKREETGDSTNGLEDEDALDEDDEVSLIPDAAGEASSPSAETAPIPIISGDGQNAATASEKEDGTLSAPPGVEDAAKKERRHPLSESVTMDVDEPGATGDANSKVAAADENKDDNADKSSLATPSTSVTKPSDQESISSLEVKDRSRQQSVGTASEQAVSAKTIKTPVPFLLRGTLREYQHYGLDWLAGLYKNNINGILADEMGLGKTIQTIALLAHLACEHQVWGPHLVIVPTSVMLNWEMEFKKFLPGFKILSYYGTIDERKKKRQGWANDDTWNVCITSYQLVLADKQVFRNRQWHYMILDEAHNIKNFQSLRWQTLLGFNTRARLLLTGTPLQNKLEELWSLLFFLMPTDSGANAMEGFADLTTFSKWFSKPQDQILENGRETMDADSKEIVNKLHKVLRPYLLRRMKADVEKQMPAKYEHVEYCRLSRRQRELYDGFLSRAGTKESFASGNYLSIINCLMQLRKVCNHPDLFLERPILSSIPMKRSVIADYEARDTLVRKLLSPKDIMSKVSLDFLNLVPTRKENISLRAQQRSNELTSQRILMNMRETQLTRAETSRMHEFEPSTVKANLTYFESASRYIRYEELQHIVYLNALRRQSVPVYGKDQVEHLTLGNTSRIFRRKPARKDLIIDWMSESRSVLKDMVLSVEQRSEQMDPFIRKFACITPRMTTPDALPILLSRRGVAHFQTSPDRFAPDPFHESRMRLSVQFPDKRLLQYDCGKLQALDKLLRRLIAGGHRALIFTQMTKVLDILEQFLNIHGHRYLRLDGATKIEQRQILTDRFNNDPRIPVFILSSRSGGLGINLTGADTVIFYDLDWNPAMDKQCQDRAHRIGQTRDVHIYRLVSEHTIEVNILKKANQKRMLDDVVIQEGEFTTDYLNKPSDERLEKGDVDEDLLDGDAAASAAMDRILGGPDKSTNVQRVLEQAEDKEDVEAAKVAQQENQTDDQDFGTNAPTAAPTPRDDVDASGAPTPAPDIMVNGEAVVEEEEVSAEGVPIQSIDEYMLRCVFDEVKDVPFEVPKEKTRDRRGKDRRKR